MRATDARVVLAGRRVVPVSPTYAAKEAPHAD
jgi:hypothetical protein